MRKKRRDLSSSELANWLDLLSGSDEGTIKLINMFLSYHYKFIRKGRMLSFLADCVSLGASTAVNALMGFNHICGRDNTYFAVLSADPLAMSGRLMLVTTMRSDTFHRYILGRPKTKVKRPIMLPQPKSRDVADEMAFRNALSRETSHIGWYNDKGTLGKPAPDPCHVWFVSKRQLDATMRVDSRNNPVATKARDVLGLINHRSGTYLLSVQFSATQLHTNFHDLRGFRMARPSFSDNGNRRFAVYLNKAAESAYLDKWGMTVHLGKLATKPHRSINGVRERVCSPLPLKLIGGMIEVKPLGWVVSTRGEKIGVDDDKAFIEQLRGSWALPEIKRLLIAIANAP